MGKTKRCSCLYHAIKCIILFVTPWIIPCLLLLVLLFLLLIVVVVVLCAVLDAKSNVAPIAQARKTQKQNNLFFQRICTECTITLRSHKSSPCFINNDPKQRTFPGEAKLQIYFWFLFFFFLSTDYIIYAAAYVWVVLNKSIKLLLSCDVFLFYFPGAEQLA